MIARLEKEIARYEAAAATVRIGGLTKVGKELELVLKAAYAKLCGVHSRDPETEILHATDARSFEKATLGQLARAIQHFPARGRQPLPTLQRDVGIRGGAVSSFIDLRNRTVVHPGGPEPTPELVLPVLRHLLTTARATLRESP